METGALAVLMSRALSPSIDPAHTAAWLEGFLQGSGMLLITDQRLWQMVDDWVCGLPAEIFTTLLPLIRRTFATFPLGERRLIGEQVAGGAAPGVTARAGSTEFDPARAERMLPVLAALLGVSYAEGGDRDDG